MPRSRAVRADSRRAASDYLRELLLKPGDYRQAWERHAARERRGTINQLAVANVLACHLRSSPRTAADASATPDQLTAMVSRALTGRLLSRQALTIFIDGFGFSEHEAGRLWRLWNGAATISVMSGTRAVPAGSEPDVDAAFGPRKHHTLALHDYVWVGADRRIDRARTIHVIEAIAPALDRVPVMFDAAVLTLEVGPGCKELIGGIQRIGPDIFATQILLSRTLDIGETLSFEFVRTYRHAGCQAPSEREHRRAVLRHADGLDMRVEFAPSTLPARVWWAHWDGADGPVLEREAVTLDSQHSAHRYLRSLEKTVAGFYWEWDADTN